MGYTNLLGTAVILLVMSLTGELYEAATIIQSDTQTLVLLVLMGISTFCGVSVYMVAVKHYSGVIVVAVSTARKCATVVLSFLFFAHKANSWHLASGMVLCTAIVARTMGGKSKAIVVVGADEEKGLTPSTLTQRQRSPERRHGDSVKDVEP